MTITQKEMKELNNECSQIGCNDKVDRIVYWLGKTPPLQYCLTHALKAKAILNAIGIQVYVEEKE